MNCRYSIYCREPVTRFYIYNNYDRNGEEYTRLYAVCETHKMTNYIDGCNEMTANEFEVWKVLQI
jgi:L-rhamnose mutarotase